MTTPLWVNCPSTDEIPPVEQIRGRATAGPHVVLVFPPGAFSDPRPTKASVLARLGAALPDCSVFDSGCERVTVVRVVRSEDVAANAAAFLGAMRLFRRTAADLAGRLAARLGVAPAQLLDAVLADQRDVDLGGGWWSGHHGLGCRFENRVTGQVVDVRLNFGAEFGGLDPYDFAVFVKTTPGLEPLGRLLGNNSRDGARVLDLFRASGLLVRVDGRFGSGWVCREDDPPPDPSSPCQAPPGFWGES